MNPKAILKFKNIPREFERNHPKVAAYLKDTFQDGVEVGTEIELRVTKPGNKTSMAKIKVTEADVSYLNDLRECIR